MGFSWLLDIRKHYTGQRRIYPFVFGVLFWIAWVASSLLGPGNYDLGDNLIGPDYMMGYTSGLALSEGAVDELFDYDAQLARQLDIVGDTDEASFSLNLPILQWVYVPFAQLPYLWSFVAWTVVGFGLLWLALKLLDRTEAMPLALTFIPIYSNFTFGQNSFISLLILAAVYVLWSKDLRFLGGLVLALLLYKPQLVTGVGLLWLLNARRDWPALAGFGAGTGVVAGISFGLMPQAMADWFDFARNGLGDLAGIQEFPNYHMHNPRGFFALLTPPIADPLWLIAAAIGVGAFVYVWREGIGRHDESVDKPFWFAAAVLVTMWATPHALIYDWTMLIIPAILLWQARPQWHNELASLYIWGWIAYALSLPITLAQQAVLPVAVQLSTIYLGLAMVALVRLSLGFQTTAVATPYVPSVGRRVARRHGCD